jgi:hypothetical protein
VIEIYLTRLKAIRDSFFALSMDMENCVQDFSEILSDVVYHGKAIEEQMKQFKEGFAYERPKTPSRASKKPVLHGVEPQRNKRKRNQVSKYDDSSL